MWATGSRRSPARPRRGPLVHLPTAAMETTPALAKPPQHVAELALACVEYVRRSTDSTLDWTPDTLPFLDAWVRQAREQPRPEVVQLLAPAVGAYFGEVIRKVF